MLFPSKETADAFAGKGTHEERISKPQFQTGLFRRARLECRRAALQLCGQLLYSGDHGEQRLFAGAVSCAVRRGQPDLHADRRRDGRPVQQGQDHVRLRLSEGRRDSAHDRGDAAAQNAGGASGHPVSCGNPGQRDRRRLFACVRRAAAAYRRGTAAAAGKFLFLGHAIA